MRDILSWACTDPNMTTAGIAGTYPAKADAVPSIRDSVFTGYIRAHARIHATRATRIRARINIRVRARGYKVLRARTRSLRRLRAQNSSSFYEKFMDFIHLFSMRFIRFIKSKKVGVPTKNTKSAIPNIVRLKHEIMSSNYFMFRSTGKFCAFIIELQISRVCSLTRLKAI